METGSVNLTAIIGIIGAILTVLIKFFDVIKSWKKSRENELRIKKEIDYSIKEVSFIKGWLDAVNTTSGNTALDSRREIALVHLDKLMSNYESQSTSEKIITTQETTSKGNKGFYAISIFLVLGVLGMFIDDDDNWSISYFQNNLDSDSFLGLAFFCIIWVYFLFNSRLYSKYRKNN